MGGVEYQVTKVDPTDPHTKGAVYQVHKVSEEVAATLGGKVYRARIIKDPTDPTVAGKVYQIVLIGDPDDPAVKGKVYNAILTGGSEAVIVGPDGSPLSLPDAIANSLSYVKAFGGTEQNGTPTPDAPVDIVCNNGVLKVRHQSGLPLGYQKVESLTFTSGAYIITDIYPNQDTEFIVDVKKNADNLVWLFGARDYPSTTSLSVNKFALQGISSSRNTLWFQFDNTTNTEYNSVAVTSTQTERLARHTFGIKNKRIYMDGEAVEFGSYGVPDWSNFTTLNPLIIGGNYQQSGGILGSFSGDLYGATGLILCKRLSDNVSGLYNPTTGNFFPADGTGTITAGDPVSDPVEIYTDGTVETIKDSLNNTATAEMLLKVGDYQDVQEILAGDVTRKVGIKVFDGTETFISGQNGWITEAVQDQYWENTNPYAPICSHFVGTSDTPTSGSNTVRVYRTSSRTGRIYFGLDKTIYTSATVFQQWLAAQYAAGTPVIVIYPLATQTTESVAGQALQVTGGDNVLEITQASLTGLELEAQYEKELE